MCVHTHTVRQLSLNSIKHRAVCQAGITAFPLDLCSATCLGLVLGSPGMFQQRAGLKNQRWMEIWGLTAENCGASSGTCESETSPSACSRVSARAAEDIN